MVIFHSYVKLPEGKSADFQKGYKLKRMVERSRANDDILIYFV